MGALSGKVIIVIIACVSVLVISSIVAPIVAIYSGGETTSTTSTTSTTITTTTMSQGAISGSIIYGAGMIQDEQNWFQKFMEGIHFMSKLTLKIT